MSGRAPLHRGFFSRVLVYGVLLVSTSALVVAGLGYWMARPALDRNVVPFLRWTASHFCGSMVAQASARAAGFPGPISFFDRLGRPLSPTPLGALDPQWVSAAPDGPTPYRRGGHAVMIIPCPQRDRGEVAFLSVPGPEVGLSPRQLALALGCVLLTVVLLSYSFARTIARPLQALGVAARAFGRGDLLARAPKLRGDELGTLAETFNEMADRVQASLRSEKELLANISHELRTPMARIRVVLEMLQDSPARAPKYIGEVVADLSELEHLLDRVLLATRLDLQGGRMGTSDLPLQREPVDLVQLVRTSVERCRGAHPEREITAETQGDATVTGDAVLTRRAVENVLDNAVKHGRGRVAVSVSARPHAVDIVVTDQGPGLSPEDARRVFEPFFRADVSRSRGSGGLGLGLTLVRRIAEAQGGEVALESRPGESTTVRLTFSRS